MTIALLIQVILSSVWDQEHGQHQNTKENRPEVPHITTEKAIKKGNSAAVAEAKPAKNAGGLEKKKKKASAAIIPEAKKSAGVKKKVSKCTADVSD